MIVYDTTEYQDQWYGQMSVRCQGAGVERLIDSMIHHYCRWFATAIDERMTYIHSTNINTPFPIAASTALVPHARGSRYLARVAQRLTCREAPLSPPLWLDRQFAVRQSSDAQPHVHGTCCPHQPIRHANRKHGDND